MKTTTLVCTMTLLLAALSACGRENEATDSDLAGVPEQSALQLNVSDDPESEGLATMADAVDPASDLTTSLSAVPDAFESEIAPELAHARAAVRRLNDALRAFLQPIAALVRDSEPSQVRGNVRTYGPLTRGETEYRFVLRRGLGARYGWLLQARPAGSTADFSSVAAGRIAVGYQARRGHGSMGVDLDALASVEPTVNAGGRVLASFAQGPNGSALSYRLRGFTPNVDETPAVDAVVQGVHLDGGYNRARLAYFGNVDGSSTDAEELVLARVRHRRGIGGRADVLAVGGDVEDGRALVVSECWSPGLEAGFRVVRSCPGDGIGGERCEIVKEVGSPSNCPRALLTPEYPPIDPGALMADGASPEGTPEPPSEMPDGEP